MSGTLVFQITKDTITTDLLRLGLDSADAKLGLGTSSPAFPLHVEGDGYIGGDLTILTAARVSSTSSQLVLGKVNTITLSAITPSASRTYTFSDVGANANFAMTEGDQTINGTKTFGGTLVANTLSSNMIPPIGTIVSYNPGYYTATANVGFTVVGPSSNTVAAVNAYLPSNWRVCDGTALINASSPIWNAAGRFLPHLTNNRFIMGSTITGTNFNNSTSVTLTVANLPTHSHSIAHDHGSFNSGDQSQVHTHGIDPPSTDSGSHAGHSHPQLVTNPDPTSGNLSGRHDYVGDSAKMSAYAQGTRTGDAGTHLHSLNIAAFNSGDSSRGHEHPVDVPNITGSSGPVGSGSSFDILPNYLTNFYIIRIF